MNCSKIKLLLEGSKKTLLWEYGFKEETFAFTKSTIYDPHLGYECKNILKTLYLFFKAKNYQHGNFWRYSGLDNTEQKDFFNSFLEVLKKYHLFYKIDHEGRYRVNLILMHYILPDYYINDFLEAVKKIYEEDYDYKFYIQKLDKNELFFFFQYSLNHFQNLIENDETFIIFKDLIFRTAKSFELIENGISENRYELPLKFFEEIKKFVKNENIVKRKRDKFYFKESKVKTSFELEDSVYFFDENRELMNFDIGKNYIFLAENPKYIILKKELTEWIEDLEDYFSSSNFKYEIERCEDYILYELIDEILDEEIGEYTFKPLSQTSKLNLKIKPKKEFPKFLSSLEKYEICFDGFIIENFEEFSSVSINGNKIDDRKVNKKGKIKLQATASLGKEVNDKTIIILPFKNIDINEKEKKILIENREYSFDDEIEIDGFKFKVNLPNIKIEERGKNVDILLYRNLEKYSIIIKNFQFRRGKIVYKDSNDVIIDKKSVRNFEERYNLPNFSEYENFPIYIFFETKNFKKLIGTIYKTEIVQKENTIDIIPKNKNFSIFIQSKWDIFQKPKVYEENIINYQNFPKPKNGDFLVYIVDKASNRNILEKTVTVNRQNFIPRNKLIKFFQKVIPDIALLDDYMTHLKNISNELKNIANVSYHLIDEDIRYKFNIYLEELDKRYKNEIDEYIKTLNSNFLKLKYLLLFQRKFFIDKEFENTNLSDYIILMITNRFLNKLSGLTTEHQLKTFKNIIEKNNKESRKDILEILSINEMQDIINKSQIRLL